jgi:hypothetical protein
MLSICLRRFAAPAITSSGFSVSSCSGSGRPAIILYLPEWAFSALTVVTTTAASGCSPEVRHLILKNRSASMSAPKPASVTRQSPEWIPISDLEVGANWQDDLLLRSGRGEPSYLNAVLGTRFQQDVEEVLSGGPFAVHQV